MWFWKSAKGRVVQKRVTLLWFKWETRSGDGGWTKVSCLSLQTPFANWLSRLLLTALNVNFGKGAWPLTSGEKVAAGCSARRGLRLHCKPSSSVASRSGRLSSQLLEERRTTAHVCLRCHFLHWGSEDASQLATTLLVSRSTTALTAKISSTINNKDTNYRLTINSRFIFCIVIVWD